MTGTNPTTLFTRWFEDAKASDPKDWNAVCVSTVGQDGRPSARMVLLKGFDDSGFVFYTNLGSRKARELKAHPFAAMTFYWGRLDRQVRIEGKVEPVSDEEADAYFASRGHGSQVGAWASRQSESLDARETLVSRVEEFERRFENAKVPRPPNWSGFRLVPNRVEFWTGLPDRLHERVLFRRTPQNGWTRELLYP